MHNSGPPLVVALLAIAYVVAVYAGDGASGNSGGARPRIEPFPLKDVRLLDTSIQIRYERLNAKYLLEMLDPDRLLWSFRKTAGLPTPGQPYVGSWEDANCELRGHFVGHYLSALALAWAGTGQEAFQSRLDLMVNELRKVQQAIGSGYLSAFPTALIDKVEQLQFVWAPYYTIHKIMAGLVDAWELGENVLALDMVKQMVAYHWGRTQALIQAKGAQHWQEVLNNEYGGMNEVLYRLHRITGDPNHLTFATMFDKIKFRDHLIDNYDSLNGRHANTHLAQVAGFALGYEETGNATLRQAVENFFDIVTEHHGFATGGTSAFERWQKPDEMGEVVWQGRNPNMIHETCTQYNMLKLARSLFTWTGDVFYADHYERALVNGILGTARLPPEDWAEDESGHTGHHHHHHHGHGHHHHHHEREALEEGGAAEEEEATGPAITPLPAGAPVVEPYTRNHDAVWMDYIAFSKPKPEWNASDAHGPGVFLYFLTMGSGQSKSDNLHHWGFPFHSFWCCYGTVVESYAKLADSIYFREMIPEDEGNKGVVPPPRLYVNQLVSSRLAWRDMGLQVTMEADPFDEGASTTALIALAALAAADTNAAAAAKHNRTFTLMLRIPAWANAQGITLELNGFAFNGCPGAPAPNSFCRITRQWSPRDRLAVRFVYRWWVSSIQDKRPQYSRLKAVMMGPHVMAGMSHEDATLGLPAPIALQQGGLGRGAVGVEQLQRVYAPEDADELMSLQTGWNASLFMRHDNLLVYASALEDGGDWMDGTFRIGRGCHHGHGHNRPGAAGTVGVDVAGAAAGGAGGAAAGAGDGGTVANQGLLSELHGAEGEGGEGASTRRHLGHDHVAHAYHSLHHLMKMGQHDSGQVSLEAMNYPNHYIAHDHAGVIVLQPGAPEAARGSPWFAPCSRAGWMMKPGLDGAPGSVSFEAADKPGHYISAQPPKESRVLNDTAPCMDDPDVDCPEAKRRGQCKSSSFVAQVLCRSSCERCTCCKWNGIRETYDRASPTYATLRLRPVEGAEPGFAATASFRLAPPARRAYPAGSYILAGSNRHYLLAPLGNLVDERYSVYYDVRQDADWSLLVPGRGDKAEAAEAEAKAAEAAAAKHALVVTEEAAATAESGGGEEGKGAGARPEAQDYGGR